MGSEMCIRDSDRDLMLHAKQLGFSDQQIAKLTNSDFFEVRKYRKELNIIPIKHFIYDLVVV